MIQEETASDILLIMCPFWGPSMPPLGLAYLSTSLAKKSYKVKILDFNIELFNSVDEEFRNLWVQKDSLPKAENYHVILEDKIRSIIEDKIHNWANWISKAKTKVVGFSVYKANVDISLALAKRIKEIDRTKIIIFGGPHILERAEYEHLCEGIVDIFVIGEAEETIVDVMEGLKKGDLSSIPGISFYKSGEYTEIICRKPTRNIDAIPYPTFNEFHIPFYCSNHLPLLFSRGCINSCNFCVDHLISKPYRSHSSNYLFENIKFQLEKNGVSNFCTNDNMINGDIEKVDSLCEMILGAGFKIRWSGNASIRPEMNSKRLEMWNKAGCERLSYGIESGSPKVLKILNKRFTLQEAEAVIFNTKKASIKCVVNFMVGAPGEGEAEFQETLKFIERNRESIDCVGVLSILTISESSHFGKKPEKFGIVWPKFNPSEEWVDVWGNTQQIRQERFERLKALLESLKIPYPV